jgi:tetratricopeptide (TPR) repeat protein
MVLAKKGTLGAAIKEFQAALRLKEDYAEAHNNLGLTLALQGDLERAIQEYQAALRLKKNFPEALCNLGNALLARGQFAEALAALKRGHALGSKKPGWSYPSAQWVRACERLLELDARLPALLKGEAQPIDALDRLRLANLCQRYKKRYLDAVRFYTDAFTDKLQLTSDQQAFVHYNAACAAVHAAAGEGKDAPKLTDKEKGRLRQQALAWLRDVLNFSASRLDELDGNERAGLRQALAHWRQDADLASVRGENALTQLPQAERQAWERLWTDLDQLLQRSDGKR